MIALFLLLKPAFAAAPPAEVWGYEKERFLQQLKSRPQEFLADIPSSEVVPRELLQLGSGAPYYLAVYFLKLERGADAEKLLRLAAVGGDPVVQSESRAALLELLLRRGELREAQRSAERFLTDGDEQPGYAAALFEALLRQGGEDHLAQALRQYAPLFSPEGEREVDDTTHGRYHFYRMYSAYLGDRAAWRRHLLETAAAVPEEALPVQWYRFTAGRGEGGFELSAGFPNAARLDHARLSAGASALVTAKAFYHTGAYRRAAAEYQSFLSAAARTPGLRRYFGSVLFDELVRAALYSGTIRQTLEYFETLRAKYPAEFHQPEEPWSPDGEKVRQLFWVLETRGYLYRRMGRFSAAAEDYRRALRIAPEGERERMRWYRLDSLMRSSPARALEYLPQLIGRWENSAYYDDALSDLADLLINRDDWKTIVRATEILDSTDSYAAGRFAFLAARAAEAGLVSAVPQQIVEWYHRAAERCCGTGAHLYYRILAVERLTALGEKREQWYGTEHNGSVPPFCTRVPGSESPLSWRDSAGGGKGGAALIRGYLRYGLELHAYRRYGDDEDFLARLDSLTVRKWTAALQTSGSVDHSIRLLTRYLRLREAPVSLAEAKMLYPRPFSEHFAELSEEYRLPEHIFYALVREESYFDPAISSTAGAVGLAQLMPSTARDVASRIGLDGYELTNPAVNLRLGAWYLDHLRGRTDSYLRALFAYNGGLTRVRRWGERYAGLPEELLLEALPYEETRHYGRKVLVSSVIYGYLYHGRPPGSVVVQIFGGRDHFTNSKE